MRELGDEILAKIAHELTSSLRQNVTVDWNNNCESVRARLRLMVKRILRSTSTRRISRKKQRNWSWRRRRRWAGVALSW